MNEYQQALLRIIDLEDKNTELLEELETCVLQIEYLHEKFQETGSGNATMASATEAIRKAKEN